MSKDLLKRVAPGLATALGRMMLCLALTSPALSQGIVDTPTPSGSVAVLEAPRIAEYWMSATLQPGGVTIFDGYAPDEVTRQAMSQRPGADISWLQLGQGAPERYGAGVDFGLGALNLMSEGRFALRDNVITIAGIARSAADFDALRALVSGGAPQGLVLARGEISAPRAARYEWAITKSSTGGMTLTGFVPGPEAEAELMRQAGGNAVASLRYASGEPNNFLASAQAAIALLQRLSDGRIAFDGTAWLVTGSASAADKQAIEADFAGRQLAAAGWSMAIAVNAVVAESRSAAASAAATEGPAIAEPQTPAIDPSYAFSATRAADGATILSGQVPTDPALRFFGTIAQGDTAAVSVAGGAPADFLVAAEAGLRSMALLDEGQLDFSGGIWSLRGAASDETARGAALAGLPDGWSTDISLVAPVATAPAATPTPGPATASIAACTAPLADFSARNAILFQSGAAIIAAESQSALDELATDLSSCPDAVVQVEGHTDADGDDGLNLALSVARAEAVIEALIQRGVTAERLYAVGYGEAKPIADNETAAGKRLNRRIVVSVQPPNY